MEAIIGALGPMASSARDLGLWCRVMLQYEPWYLEPSLLNMPWKQDVVNGIGLPSKSTFAILWDDGVVAPHPPIVDALKRTKKALLAAGHEVIDWMPVEHQKAWDLLVRVSFAASPRHQRC
jgi:amidase